jgi:ribosomal-protein-alanine N-acetyltransferase
MKLDENGRMVEFGEFPTLETEHLILRQMTVDDARFYFRHFSEPTIVELTAYEAPANIDAAREELLLFCIDNFKANTGIRWGVMKKGGTDLIGTLGFHNWVKDGGYHARAGYDLVPEERRKGIMTEAFSAAIDYAFREMRLNRIEVLIAPENEASIRLVRKLGFKFEGILREHALFRGKFLDDAVYSLLSSEWTKK